MAKHRTILAIVETDRSFVHEDVAGRDVWIGRCIYCNSRLAVALDGKPISGVTIEHLRSRHHGGDDDLRNLALSCGGCNAEKGMHIDNRRASDPRAMEVVERALARRAERWRDPPAPLTPPTPSRRR